jgi:hypothetical protein
MLTHNTLTCCHEGCYAVITLHPDDEQRLRRTHEWFYCPAVALLAAGEGTE